MGGRSLGVELQQERLVAGVLSGKSQSEAARDAGYAPGTAASAASRALARPQTRAMIRSILAEAGFDPVEQARNLVQIAKESMQYGITRAGDVVTLGPAWRERLAATELAARMWGDVIENTKIDVAVSGNVHVVHMQPEDGVGGRERQQTIDVTPDRVSSS